MCITSTSHEGPRQRARHFTAVLKDGATDASSIGWGGVVNAGFGPFRAGGVFPRELLSRYVNSKEMYGLYLVLQQFCARHPRALRRAKVVIDVDSQPVVGAFKRGCAKDPVTHALLIQLFDLQVSYCFLLTLRWIPTASNAIADAISRPSRESIIRLHPDAFQAVWSELGPFSIDLMASTVSTKCVPQSSRTLPFFSQYACEGSSGVDVLAQDVSCVPCAGEPAFGFCPPPPVMVGHVVQHLAECEARAVILVPDKGAYWFPLVHRATVRSLEVAPGAAEGFFQCPGSDVTLHDWRYPKWAMRAYEVDFRSHGS